MYSIGTTTIDGIEVHTLRASDAEYLGCAPGSASYLSQDLQALTSSKHHVRHPSDWPLRAVRYASSDLVAQYGLELSLVRDQFYQYELFESVQPVNETPRPRVCEKCNGRLGSQNPGFLCSGCR